MACTRKEVMIIDEVTNAVAAKIGIKPEVFRNSQTMHMKKDSPNRQHIVALSQISMRQMLEMKAKMFGEKPPPQPEHFFSDRVYEIFTLRAAIELELLEGLKNDEVKLREDR